LAVAGLTRQSIQYDIGNPLTASKMTRHQLSAGLYAPIRVLLPLASSRSKLLSHRLDLIIAKLSED